MFQSFLMTNYGALVNFNFEYLVIALLIVISSFYNHIVDLLLQLLTHIILYF